MKQVAMFWLAGGLSAIWLVFHVIQGGKEVVRPLQATSTIDPVVRDTLYLCWHFITASLFIMAASFFLAIALARPGIAMIGTALAWGYTLTGIVQVIAIRARYRDLPQGWLFLPIAALGTIALMP
jgi:hypothetical protein